MIKSLFYLLKIHVDLVDGLKICLKNSFTILKVCWEDLTKFLENFSEICSSI